jgi:hypothetical protein
MHDPSRAHPRAYAKDGVGGKVVPLATFAVGLERLGTGGTIPRSPGPDDPGGESVMATPCRSIR